MIPSYVLSTVCRYPYTAEAILLSNDHEYLVCLKAYRREHRDMYLSGLNFMSHTDSQTKEYLQELVSEELNGDI